MKKIIIVIHNLDIGGAQRSLISFLKCMQAPDLQKEYEIHVLPIDYSGNYISHIPNGIKIIEPPRVLRWMGTKINAAFVRKYFSMKGILGEARWILQNKTKSLDQRLNIVQRLWKCWKVFIPGNPVRYDTAISYMDGTSSYYVMDKISAGKKVLWVHSEYQKQRYYPEFDAPYYNNCDRIITISERCKACLCTAFPKLSSKISVLENITIAEDIIKKSYEDIVEYTDSGCLKLLSVGRLHPQKGMDIAIKAACELKSMGLRFNWQIIGDGEEKETLQKLIFDFQLQDCVHLMGKKENPYAYMRKCDIVVQPSRVEGKSIVLDEAKILCKPIIATNYSTVGDSIAHGKNGWVVDIDEHALAQGIAMLAQNEDLRNSFSKNLGSAFKGNESELRKYIDIML